MGDSAAYKQLVDLEREIDYKILTKQTQIADAAFKVSKVRPFAQVPKSTLIPRRLSGY